MMKTTALLLASAATLTAAAGHERTIHVQYDTSECFGENSDPHPGPEDKHHIHQCHQTWCPNRHTSSACILRDMKGKMVGLTQFDHTVSYYKHNKKDKRAEAYVSQEASYFFHGDKHAKPSALHFSYPYISKTGADAYNNGHFSVNTLSGSGMFEHIGTHGNLDIKASDSRHGHLHRVVAIHFPEKHHSKGYGDQHSKGYGDQHAKDYGDQHAKDYGDQHSKGYGDQTPAYGDGYDASSTGSGHSYGDNQPAYGDQTPAYGDGYANVPVSYSNSYGGDHAPAYGDGYSGDNTYGDQAPAYGDGYTGNNAYGDQAPAYGDGYTGNNAYGDEVPAYGDGYTGNNAYGDGYNN